MVFSDLRQEHKIKVVLLDVLEDQRRLIFKQIGICMKVLNLDWVVKWV